MNITRLSYEKEDLTNLSYSLYFLYQFIHDKVKDFLPTHHLHFIGCQLNVQIFKIDD